MAVYFFYGEEDFNIDLELEKMRSKLNPDFLSMSYKVMNNPLCQDMVTALRSAPMMFGSSLTVIDIKNYFFKSDDEEDNDYILSDAALDDIKDALDNNQEGLDIVFIIRIPRNGDKKIDTRRKFFKILSKYNTKEFQPFKSYKVTDISNWIKNRAKDKKLKINDDAVNLLIEQIGTNLRDFDCELEKLKLVAYPDSTITKKMIEENCISNEDLFNMTRYLMNGEKAKAVDEYRQLLNKKYPLEIISALQTMLRKWIIIKSKSSASYQELKMLTGLGYDFMIDNLKRDLKNVSLKYLVNLKENLFEVEYRIKSGKVQDMDSEVEIALIK